MISTIYHGASLSLLFKNGLERACNQDIDPLSDTVPPRYAVESDEEEDEINPLPSKPSSQDTTVNVKIAGDLPTGSTVAVATGDVAAFWAKGASLGEQIGAVFVNDVQV